MRVRALLTTVFVVIFFSAFMFYQFSKADEQTSLPKADNGYLDLSGYELSDSDPIRLDGEWEFVHGKLVQSDYFVSQNQFLYVSVPSLWRNYEMDGSPIPRYTSATYHLTVKVNPNDQNLAIKTTNIRMSNSLYINGELVKQSGKPAEDRSYVQGNNPYVASIYAADPMIDIVIHVANFDYATGGGILGSLYFGD